MFNLAILLEDSAREVPDRTAIIFDETRLSYAAVNVAANQVANGLVQAGIQPGDKVALSCPNLPYFPIVYYGILKAGAVVMPLNILLKPREIAYHLRDADAKAYFCFEGTPDLPLGEMGFTAVQEVDSCEYFYLMTPNPAAPSPIEGAKTLEEKFQVKILEGYGLSETSPVATFNRLERESKPGSIGLPVWGVSVRLVDQDDRDVGTNELGEIAIRGHNVMKGYYKRPEATAGAMRNGWFHTGDIGRQDEEGYIYIVDRVKDMIIRGGFNVYPREIEEVLMTHPAVSLAAVLGVPHERHGEEVKAFVILREGAELTEVELVAWSKENMADYKYPRHIEFRTTLPMTATGKILKSELR